VLMRIDNGMALIPDLGLHQRSLLNENWRENDVVNMPSQVTPPPLDLRRTQRSFVILLCSANKW